MAQSIRQRNLFAAEDFRVVYDSFKQANFQAYDYDTIRSVLVDYIQEQYPENYNDWIQSSEFVALIETLAFLAHSLAFRVDLAARENFLSTAERRSSVLRIADFLGYTPARHLPARGNLKITSIRTNQNVFDVAGQNLKNETVDFENNYQNFLLVMNEVLSANNKFGQPVDASVAGSIQTDQYATNIASGEQFVFNFDARVNGNRALFELHSTRIDKQTKTIVEADPDPSSGFDLMYLNDRQGISSGTTGFFVGFKQGQLSSIDLNASTAISNLVVNPNTKNVNNSDIWLQNISSDGTVEKTWTAVDSSFGAGQVFNNISNELRDLYTVKTVDNDNINVVFGDGVFSNIPRGTIRLWYRTGLNQTYTLNPEDVGTVNFGFKYDAADGNQYTVNFDAELQNPISNASARESVVAIKQNAGRVFATQDRMITGDDYSVYPSTVSENVKKIKAVNRTYAGHSRYIKNQDPTAQYQSVDMIARDGYLYSEPVLYRNTVALPATVTEEQIFSRFIDVAIENPEVVNLFYEKFTPVDVDFVTEFGTFEWQQISKGYQGSTGYLTRNGVIERVGSTATSSLQYAQPGAIVEFVETPYSNGSLGVIGDSLNVIASGSGYTSAPTVEIRGTGTGASATAVISSGQITNVVLSNGGIGYQNPVEVVITGGGGTGAQVTAEAQNAERSWARVIDVSLDGLGLQDDNGNAVGLTTQGQGTVVLNKIIPNTARISRIFPAYSTDFTDEETADITEQLALRNTFGLRFDVDNSKWLIIDGQDLPSGDSDSPENFSTAYAGNKSGNNLDASWIVRVNYASDAWTIISRRTRYVFGSDGELRFYNQNGGRHFNVETNKPDRDRITVSRINTSPNGSQFPIGNDLDFFAYKYYADSDGYTNDRKIIVTVADVDNDGYPDDPTAFKDIVGLENISLTTINDNGFNYTVRTDAAGEDVLGRSNLTFIWRRISNSRYRIDPSLSNIIDIFVLNQNYDAKFRKWIIDDRRETTRPSAPSEIELEAQFQSIANKKAVSDSVVYRAAEYRVLFGELADLELQGKFTVVKVAGTTVTDNEIKTRILTAVNEFFDIDNWDFGETFYFTELSAFVHQRMQGVISSIVIVPTQVNSVFGELFQITPETNQLFIPDVTIRDIRIVDSLNGGTLT
jgi:hypothetical protein